MAIQLSTGRGVYRLASVAPLESDTEDIFLTLGMERADGIERVVFRCRISRTLLLPGDDMNNDAIVMRLQPWIEREFEQTREAALKSIRAERKLLELLFDNEHRGPF
jgi:hypothetical protein